MTFETAILAKRRGLLSALAVATVLLLGTGCAPELGAGGSAGGSGSTNDSGPNNGSEADADSEADNNDSAQANLTGAACFPGDWLVDNKGIQAYMESVSQGASVATTGRIILTYNADGTSVTNYDHWTNTITKDGATSVVERHGTDKGTYTATESGTFSGSDTTIGSVTKMTVTGSSGEATSMSVKPEPSIFNSGKYTCAGDTMELVVDGYTLSLTRQH